MLKSIKKLMAQEKEKYRIPRKVQDLIPIDCIWKDGIFRYGNRYSKVYRFTDINYQVASQDDKKLMFFDYSAILNGMDAGATHQITKNIHLMSRWDFEESVLMPMLGDEQDQYRQENNDILLGQTVGNNGVTHERYYTISVTKKNIQEARLYFARIGAEVSARFAALGSRCSEVSTEERLRILHNFFRPGESDMFHFDMSNFMRRGHDFRDYICPNYVEKHGDYLKLGDRYARVLYLKDLASFVRDDMIDELTSLNKDMMLSIDIAPIPTDEAVREVENRLLGVETNITNWQRRQNKNNNFSAVIPYDMELQRKEAKEFLDDLTTRDQRMMLVIITMVITADSKEELDNETEALKTIAQNRMCQIATLNYQQMDGLKTVLPIGVRKINAFRTLTTESLAVFMPFKVQEIQDKGGMYYGQNAISNNLILCNKENLLNQSSMLLGVPGAGKSFLTKQQIANILLSTKDEILICDPENEYGALVTALCPDSTVISLEAGGKDKLNAMYMVDGYGESDPIVVKSQFIMSLIEQIDKNGVGPQHKSIIDRCVAAIYKEAKDVGYMPTLSTLRLKLLEQPEPQAKDIALALELFTTGSLDIFGHGSNVDLEKRVTVFNIRGLGTQLKPTGLLVITDTMLNRVTLNWKRGKRTHVFIDEFHVVFENEFSAAFFNSAWRQFRKRNAYPTAITQNVEYLLDSVQASTMLSNSEFIVMLNQAASDREKLGKLLNISNEQMSFITNAEAGCGLIKYGSALVPFVNRFPKDTKLYELMTTRPGEGVFARGQAS
ncbi:MAG: ATP-binding protein [Bacteroidaceae bacterium]|nr:ATP-binding protein [Bacteroidaceae bacterium]